MKHAGGRPTKYDPAFIDEVDLYLEETKGKDSLPKIESFAIHLGVNKSTLYEWANATNEAGELIHPEFSDALDKIMLYQAERLIDDGIYGGKDVNATIVKLLLQNNHGMREKSSTDLTTNGESIQGPTVYLPKEDNG